jgi:hypothetical protein
MQVAPFPLLSALSAAPARPELYGQDLILEAAAQRKELESRLSELDKRKESQLKDSKVLQDMVQHSETQHRPQPGLARPRQRAVSAEALSPAALLSPEIQPGRPSVSVESQKMNVSTMHAHRSKEMHQKHVEPFAAPPTPTKGLAARHVTAISLHQQQQRQHIKEVDVEPRRRGYRQISTKPAAEDGEDWLSMLVQHLWPNMRQVIEDTAWDMVPRKFKYQHPIIKLTF